MKEQKKRVRDSPSAEASKNTSKKARSAAKSKGKQIQQSKPKPAELPWPEYLKDVRCARYMR